jgi:hypothetical protein
MAVPTQYIFNLHWYTQKGPVLPENQIQDVPQGGWDNWTLQHNMLWLQGKIAQRAKFVLIGSIYDLRNQGENAGTGVNSCTVGVEVLVLLHAGYTPRAPNPNYEDERGVYAVRVFEYTGNYTPASLTFVEWVKVQQNTKHSQPYGLWTEDLKDMYLRAID